MPLPAGKRDDAGADIHMAAPVVSGHGADLLERMSDAFIALDRDWRVVYMNGAAVRLNNKPREASLGRSHWEEWPHTAGSEVERMYRLAMSTQRAVHFEHHYMVPGRDFWHSIHAYPDASGLSIFFRDITQQKRTDDLAKLLATASARFVSTLDQRSMLRVVAETTIPLLGDWSVVYLVDESLRVVAATTAATSAEQHALLRQAVAQLPAVAADTRLPWTRAMQSGEPALQAELDEAFYAALGTPERRDFIMALAPRSLLCVPLLARGQTIGGMTFGRAADSRRHDEQDVLAAREVALPAGLALDTTRKYEAQRQARDDAEVARQRAEAANLSKVDFLRAMSHELRTPLNAASGYVQLLRMGARGPLPPQAQHDLERIERNQARVAGMIEDVLHFAKLDAGRLTFHCQRMAISAVLVELDDYVAPLVQERQHVLTIQPCSPDVSAWADPGKVTQILVNLVSNALKHTPKDTTIDVRCEPAGAADSHIRLTVRDDGPGIAAEMQERVFEPFVQVGRSLNRPVEGLGLGLAIARDLARHMRGDLTVASEGSGTTFTLSLPVRE